MHRLVSDRNFRLVAGVLGALGVAGVFEPGPAFCAPQEEITRRDFGIGHFKPPARWEMRPQDQSTYPQMLAWASRGQGDDRAVMTLIARRLMPGTSVQRFANESASLKNYGGLRNPHLLVQTVDGWGGHRVQLDGAIEGKRRLVVRQLFYVNETVGYILTLVAPHSQALPRLRDLEDTAASLSPIPIETGARPVPPPSGQGPVPGPNPPPETLP